MNADRDTHSAGGKIDLSDDFTGKGSIQRSGKVAAQITVTVTGITGNGELLVSGKQVIAVNDEKQEIALRAGCARLTSRRTIRCYPPGSPMPASATSAKDCSPTSSILVSSVVY